MPPQRYRSGRQSVQHRGLPYQARVSIEILDQSQLGRARGPAGQKKKVDRMSRGAGFSGGTRPRDTHSRETFQDRVGEEGGRG